MALTDEAAAHTLADLVTIHRPDTTGPDVTHPVLRRCTPLSHAAVPALPLTTALALSRGIARTTHVRRPKRSRAMPSGSAHVGSVAGGDSHSVQVSVFVARPPPGAAPGRASLFAWILPSLIEYNILSMLNAVDFARSLRTTPMWRHRALSGAAAPGANCLLTTRSGHPFNSSALQLPAWGFRITSACLMLHLWTSCFSAIVGRLPNLEVLHLTPADARDSPDSFTPLSSLARLHTLLLAPVDANGNITRTLDLHTLSTLPHYDGPITHRERAPPHLRSARPRGPVAAGTINFWLTMCCSSLTALHIEKDTSDAMAALWFDVLPMLTSLRALTLPRLPAADAEAEAEAEAEADLDVDVHVDHAREQTMTFTMPSLLTMSLLGGDAADLTPHTFPSLTHLSCSALPLCVSLFSHLTEVMLNANTHTDVAALSSLYALQLLHINWATDTVPVHLGPLTKLHTLVWHCPQATAPLPRTLQSATVTTLELKTRWDLPRGSHFSLSQLGKHFPSLTALSLSDVKHLPTFDIRHDIPLLRTFALYEPPIESGVQVLHSRELVFSSKQNERLKVHVGFEQPELCCLHDRQQKPRFRAISHAKPGLEPFCIHANIVRS